MDEKADIKFTENHYFFIAIVFIILSACAIGLSIMTFETAAPAISKVRIAHKHNKIILSYKKSGHENNKVTIEWFFNGKPEKEYEDLRLIPVPFVTGATVEIECRVSAYDSAGKPLRVKSNKIFYFQTAEKNIPAVPVSDFSSHAAAETPHESSAVILNADAHGTASADISKPPTDGSPAGHQNISELEDATASVHIPQESGSDSAAEQIDQTVAHDKTLSPPITGETAFQDATDAVEFKPPAPIFSQNSQQPMFKDNSTKKEPSLGVASTSQKAADNYPVRGEVHKPHSVRASEYYHKPHHPATIENYINNISGKHETLLHFAARCDDARLAFDAFVKGADIDARDINDSTPLHTAILNNSLETSIFLIANGANIKARDKKGRTPLHIAAIKKSKKSALLLLNKESLSNYKEINSAPGLINRLVNITDNRGQTALHTAASHDADEIAPILIENGADVNARDVTKSTPLHYAVLNKSRSVIAILIYKGADINAKDEFGQTPDYFADEDIKRIMFPQATDENQLKPAPKVK
ncbi:MAG TPA: ankyrin repeat domain-containing protein [Candidatus Wallbacteria bacterium]|nr:ankyrin repeat domain-containing protein [Candidatus Wallbacteria bacterium]